MAKQMFTGDDGKEYVVKEKKPFYKRVWFIVLAVIVVLGIVGNLGSGKNSTTTENAAVKSEDSKTKETGKTAEPVKEEPYTLSDVKVEKDQFGMTYVTGVLKNNTKYDKSYIQILFPVVDANGNKLGDAIDNVNNIKAGATWKFKATALETDKEATIQSDQPEISGF